MAEFFKMPAASPTMTEGVLGEWLVKEGAAVSAGVAVATVETDKATAEIEAFDKAVLVRHLAKPGDSVPVDFPIAIMARSADEDISALLAEFAGMSKNGGGAGAPAPATPPGSHGGGRDL